MRMKYKLAFILMSGLVVIVGCSDNRQIIEEQNSIANENERIALENKRKEKEEKELQLWRDKTFKAQEQQVLEAKEKSAKEKLTNNDNFAIKRTTTVYNYQLPQAQQYQQQERDDKIAVDVISVSGKIGSTILGTKIKRVWVSNHGKVIYRGNNNISGRVAGKNDGKYVAQLVPDYGYEIKFTLNNTSKVSKNVIATAGLDTSTLTVPPLTVMTGKLRIGLAKQIGYENYPAIIAPTFIMLSVDGKSQNFKIKW